MISARSEPRGDGLRVYSLNCQCGNDIRAGVLTLFQILLPVSVLIPPFREIMRVSRSFQIGFCMASILKSNTSCETVT
jgi:hypothetical protein